MAYKDLVIQLSRSQENEHQFIASALEAGKPVASNSFELRLDELRIMHHLLELENEAVNTKSRVTFHRDFGQELFKTVFAGELGDYFKKHLLGNGDGLRIGLQFDESASLLVKLPWEFLHDGEDFLVARRNTLLSRLPSSQKRIKSPPIESVLRMLVIISSPVDSNCAPLNTEKERDRILRAVDKLHASGKIVVDFTDIATIETIQSYLNENDYHIVHFSGHGGCTDGCSYLVLENEDLSAWVVDNQTISDLFAGRGIRLMVLSSCKCADLDLANKLARKGVPAVVSFQYSILDESASRFAEVFYSALTSGNPVDLSMTEARIAMRNAEGSNKLDFATPVLYLLDPDCLRIGKIVPDTFDLFQKPFMLGNLEAMIDGFVGRQKELIALQKVLLSSIKRAAVVYGLGGIGKTVLATRLALRMDRHFEGFFGHRCNPQTRAEDILIGLTSFLNMAGIDSLNQLMSSQAPISVKTATLVRILNQRRLLIILDNMESCLDEGGKQIADPELRDFVSALLSATVAGSKFIVTSRIDFDPLEGRLVSAVEHYHLPEMPYYEAIWLMNNHTSLAKLDFQKKKQIHKAVGGHPWSLDHFALQVSEGAEVDDLLERLEPLEKEAKAFTLFDHAHSQLDGEAKELLLRASIFEEAAPEEALRWMMGDDNTPSPSVSKPLRELLRLGLAVRQEEREIRLYSVHTLVRKFVQQEAKDKGIDLRPLLIRAAQHYEMQVKVNQNLWDLLRARESCRHCRSCHSISGSLGLCRASHEPLAAVG